MTRCRPAKSNDRVMIGQFFRWWSGQLSALFPFSIGGDGGRWLDVSIDAERVRATLSDNRERVLMDVARTQQAELQAELSRVVAALDPTRVRCRIWIAASEVLGREVELPMAAEENLREVLSFEMARKTPFRAQDVHFDALITERDSARRMLKLQLNVAPHRVLENVTTALQDWSLQAIPSADAARVAQRNGQAVFAFQSGSFARRSYSGRNLALGSLAIVLSAVCAWLPLSAQQRTSEQLEIQIQRARIEASQAMVLRDEFDAVQHASTFLADAQAARPAMVQVLDELTRVLPDTTFLSRLQIDGEEVNLHGSSQAASELIAILEQLALLKAVRFASPVTRDARSGGERFHIVGRLVTPGGDELSPAGEGS